MRQKKQLATWAQRKKRVYQINVHAICWDCFEWANIQPAVLHPIKPSCDAIESSHRIVCVRWWFLTFPLYSRLYRRVKKSATDSFFTQQKYARQPTNINLSMIYCVFNTVFKRIILCLVYWVFDCVRFAKHEPKHTHDAQYYTTDVKQLNCLKCNFNRTKAMFFFACSFVFI